MGANPPLHLALTIGCMGRRRVGRNGILRETTEATPHPSRSGGRTRWSATPSPQGRGRPIQSRRCWRARNCGAWQFCLLPFELFLVLADPYSRTSAWWRTSTPSTRNKTSSAMLVAWSASRSRARAMNIRLMHWRTQVESCSIRAISSS